LRRRRNCGNVEDGGGERECGLLRALDQSLVTEALAPAEELLRVDAMATRDGRDVDALRQALGHDRDLRLVRPIASALGLREHLDAPWPHRRRFITTVKHMVKSISRYPRDHRRL
jgi:hypothetical protein